MSTLLSGHYLRNRSTLDIGVLGYIGIVQHKEHSPEVFHIPPGTPCIYNKISIKRNILAIKQNTVVLISPYPDQERKSSCLK